VLLGIELGIYVLELAQDLRNGIFATAKPAERKVSFADASASSFSRNGKFGDDRVLLGCHTTRFAIAPGINEESLRESAFGLGFAQRQAPVPILKPLQDFRIAFRRVGAVIKRKFREQECARDEGASIVKHVGGPGDDMVP